MVASAKTVATVLLLADPQVGWFQEPQNGDLMSQESNQNAILNQLSSTTYPCVNKNINISCSGLIGAPDATFIAGDLVNYGGHYNWWEQLFSGNCPATYFGGDQLQNVSALYHPWRPLKGITQLSGCGPIYCGLGNHDILFDGEFLGFRFFDYILSDFKDFYRYQMWNYVSQLYTGYKNYTTPDNTTASTDAPYPISSENIDSVPEGTYDWKQYSLNYVVDLGPVDIYQLHLYLGDSANGRESGLDWLKGKLAQGGYARPVVIVQHYPLSYMSDSEVERMMEILLPYNVIGLHVGHEHSRGTELLTFPWPTNSPTLDWGCHTKPDLKEIRPGSVVGNSSETPHEYFGLMRVEAFDDGRTDTNILYGQVANGSIRWRHGFNVATPPPPAVYIRDLEIVNLDERNESTTLLPTLCTELSRKSSNINDGFGGKYVYIRPLLTTDPTEAITGIQFRASNNASETCKQIGQDSSVKYRCISVTREYPAKTPISNVFLLRSDTQAKLPKGMTDMTDNLNYGRNGTYLYLTWKAVGKFE